jgi:membrane fusion protein (multidrug efflux system)
MDQGSAMQQTTTIRERPQLNEPGKPTTPAAAPVPARPKSTLRPFLILGLVVLLGLAGLGVHLLATANQENTDDAQVEADVVTLAPRVGGFIKQVMVTDNQSVKRGQVLLQIDDTDLKLRVSQAEAELAVAQAQEHAAVAQEQVITAGAKGGLQGARALVSSSQVNVRSADAQISVARAAVTRAQADERKAALDLSRTRELRARDSVPQEVLDADQVSYDSAAAALDQAQAKLQAAEADRNAATSRVAQAQGTLAASEPIDAQIASAHAQSELARARREAAQAALDLVKVQLSYATVTAPEDGVVSKLGTHAGELLAVNQPIGELVPSHTYVVANFKETQIGRMHPGDRAEIEIDAYGHHTFEGKVESLSGGTGARFSLLPPDNASGNFVKVVQRVPVRIAWTHTPDVPLRVGLSADVTVQVGGS